MTLGKLIGLKLKKLRKAAGITQPALSKLVGLAGENSHITISNWERGIRRPTLDHIERYSTIFKKPMHWFFSTQDFTVEEAKNETSTSIDSMIGLIHRALETIDKIAPHPKLETAKHHLHRVIMDLEGII